MSDERTVPEGQVGRLLALGALGVRTAAARTLDPSGDGGAAAAADVLGTMRGLASKLGQMASYVDGLVPQQHRDAYEFALKMLQANAPKTKAALIRKVVEEQLGAKIPDLFSRWEDVPIASASIGQVHRATLTDGQHVAVKVQHPGVAEAVEADLANATLIDEMAAQLGGRRFDSNVFADVVRARFREELDYTHEAANMRKFSQFHAGDATIRIPEVKGAYSTRRVLTTELAFGRGFEDACKAEEDERRAWAETMWRFVFKTKLLGGMFNADPHPGNYVFGSAGEVTFLDFGCVQTLPEARCQRLLELHRAVLSGSTERVDQAVTDILDARPGPLEVRVRAFARECLLPLFASPYRIDRAYAASLVEAIREIGAISSAVEDDEHFALPPEGLFINRLQFGFYSVLARLDVEVDYAAGERAFLNGGALR